jgi:hypothetical protein
MNVYRIAPNANAYECIYARKKDRDLLFFSECQPLLPNWRPLPVLGDDRLEDDSIKQPKKGDFPSLYHPTPVFSQRAWDILSPLVQEGVEHLPLIHPSGEVYYAINVLELIDCLDLTKTKLTRNEACGEVWVSSIQTYKFKKRMLKGKHMFKIPETKGLEAYVLDEFKQAVETNGLLGMKFVQVD